MNTCKYSVDRDLGLVRIDDTLKTKKHRQSESKTIDPKTLPPFSVEFRNHVDTTVLSRSPLLRALSWVLSSAASSNDLWAVIVSVKPAYLLAGDLSRDQRHRTR